MIEFKTSRFRGAAFQFSLAFVVLYTQDLSRGVRIDGARNGIGFASELGSTTIGAGAERPPVLGYAPVN
jgi:hypothetical protein